MSTGIINNSFFLISLGAILGALLRWQINEIFLVNLIGCFLLGFFNSLKNPNKKQPIKLTIKISLVAFY